MVEPPFSTARTPKTRTPHWHQRFGWQWNIVPLLGVPGVTNVHRDLSLREKLRRATTRSLWSDSAIMAVTIDAVSERRTRG